jgi:hypothetical protein
VTSLTGLHLANNKLSSLRGIHQRFPNLEARARRCLCPRCAWCAVPWSRAGGQSGPLRRGGCAQTLDVRDNLLADHAAAIAAGVPARPAAAGSAALAHARPAGARAVRGLEELADLRLDGNPCLLELGTAWRSALAQALPLLQAVAPLSTPACTSSRPRSAERDSAACARVCVRSQE